MHPPPPPPQAPIADRVRLALCAAGLACAPLAAGPDVALHAQITQQSTERLAQMKAGAPWNIYIDRYLNGDATTPRYDSNQLAWGHGRFMAARANMHRITGAVDDLQYIFDTSDIMFANRADRLNPIIGDHLIAHYYPSAFPTVGTPHPGAIVPGWTMWDPNAANRGLVRLVHGGMATYGLVQAMIQVQSDPALQAQFGSRIAALLPQVDQTIRLWDVDWRPAADPAHGGRYVDSALRLYHAALTQGQIPWNMQNAAGTTFINLWHLTGDPFYHQRARDLALDMKRELKLVAGGTRYDWRYAPYYSTSSSEDISHAGLNVEFMVAAYEAGIVFDDTDIARLANTFLAMQKNDGFTANVNGAGTGTIPNLRLSSHWLRLADHSPAVRELFPIFQQAGMTTALDYMMILSASFFATSGEVYTPKSTYTDRFDGPQLSKHWIRLPAQPIVDRWTTSSTGNSFIVHDVVREGATQGWVLIRRHLMAQRTDPWMAEWHFNWSAEHPTAPPGASKHLFFIEFYNNTYRLARIGLEDQSLTETPGQIIIVGQSSMSTPPGSLPPSGEARIRLLSDPVAGFTQVFWNDELVASSNLGWPLTSVELVYGGFQQADGSFFGDIAMHAFDLSSGSCYANCDGSTTTPILNVDDFTCFIAEVAAASALPPEQQIGHYANCDSSTTPPILNVDDFICFISGFAQGCP